MPPSPHQLLVGWTTLESKDDALRLARLLIGEKLAACVQVDGPVTSLYEWKGKTMEDEEWRLWVKGTSPQFDQLPAFLDQHHPYDTPQWVVVGADFIAEKYLRWAEGDG